MKTLIILFAIVLTFCNAAAEKSNLPPQCSNVTLSCKHINCPCGQDSECDSKFCGGDGVCLHCATVYQACSPSGNCCNGASCHGGYGQCRSSATHSFSLLSSGAVIFGLLVVSNFFM